MCVRTVILMMSLIFLGCGNVNDTSTLVSEDGAPEYTASRSLLYSWYFNHPTCFQHKARHDKINDGKQFMSAFRANKDCPRIPDRPKSCSGGGLWKDRPFLVDGTCPTTIFSTSHWRPRDKDGRPGYSFSMSDDKHPVITLKNQAFGVEGKFQHKEASFGFHEFAEQLIKRPDGTNHSPFDFDALLVEFDAKAKMTRSKKTK